MSNFFLSKDEVKELTGRIRKDCQVEALRFMGIEHRVRPDSSIAVLRAHVEQSLGLVNSKQKLKAVEPNWSAL